MKWKVLVPVLILMFLAGCRGTPGSAVPDPPKEVTFSITMSCDLTDAEGGILHCEGPANFYGTIDGTAEGMSGDDPAWFNFTVPYSSSYTFETPAESFYVMSTSAYSGSTISSVLYTSKNAGILWGLDRWEVQSQGTDLEFTANRTSQIEQTFLAKAAFHTDGNAEILWTDGQFTVTGASGAVTLTFSDTVKGRWTEELELLLLGDSFTVDYTGLADSRVLLTNGSETQELTVSWAP